MLGPMGPDHSSRIPANVVSELERLRSQVAELTGENMTDANAEFRLRAQVSELQESAVVERPRVRQRVGIPPMPVLVPADLSSRREERQPYLQVALGSTDSARVVEVTTKLAAGARRLAEMMSTQ